MMKPKDTAPLLWLALVLAVALAIAFLLPVTPNDYWWYLRIGRDTLSQGAIPTTDTLTWSQAGTPVVYHAWGAAVLFWLVYQTGELTLTVLLRGLVVVIAYGLVWWTARKLGAGRAGAALTLLLAVLASSNNWSLRPQLLAYPLFALALLILYKWHRGGNPLNTKEHEGNSKDLLQKHLLRPERSRTFFVRRSRRTGLQENSPSTALLADARRSAQGVSETYTRGLEKRSTSAPSWHFVPACLRFLGVVVQFFRSEKDHQNLVYWLPLLSLVWVNLHGSFVMLILLAGAALAFGRGDRRPLALAFAGVVLATLGNPRGVGAWTYVFQSLTVQSSQLFSAEWRPPVNDNWQMNLFFLWLLAFPLLAAFSPRKLSLLEWTWFLGFGFLALWGERYVIWFVFILTALTASLLADWETKYLGDPKPGSPLLNRTLGLVFILLTLSLLPGVRDAWWTDAPEATENTPVAATAWLEDHPEVEGPLWSEIGFSSYLEFALPERPTWIDTRFEVFPVEQWQAYKDISGANYNWQTLLDATGAELALVSTMTQPDLVSALDGSSAWCELYRNDVAVLYQHCGGDQ